MSPYRTSEPLTFGRTVQPDEFLWLADGRGVRASYVHTALIDGRDQSCLVCQDGSTFPCSADEARYVAGVLGLTP